MTFFEWLEELCVGVLLPAVVVTVLLVGTAHTLYYAEHGGLTPSPNPYVACEPE